MVSGKRAWVLILLVAPLLAEAAVVDDMLNEFRSESKVAFSVDEGRKMWNIKHKSKKDRKMRSCTACHGKDLTQVGKHQKTGKRIDPLAPSVTRDRLTDRKKIKKWFKRNCKWTFGRECTSQEKGHFLTYIKSQ